MERALGGIESEMKIGSVHRVREQYRGLCQWLWVAGIRQAENGQGLKQKSKNKKEEEDPFTHLDGYSSLN